MVRWPALVTHIHRGDKGSDADDLWQWLRKEDAAFALQFLGLPV